jgi:Ras-related protein Rab-7A
MLQDSEVNVQVWDTAGQERFTAGSVGAAYFRNADGALLVYDVSNEKSFEQLEMWRDECMSRQDRGEYFPIVVIGNKTDIRDAMPECERPDQSDVLGWCRQNSYGHIETSAKDGQGVEAAMMAIVALALENQRHYFQLHHKHGSKADSTSSSATVDLSKKYEQQNSGCGTGCG